MGVRWLEGDALILPHFHRGRLGMKVRDES
jgi:hypothetical protein